MSPRRSTTRRRAGHCQLLQQQIIILRGAVGAYLEEGVHHKGEVVLPTDVLESDGVDEGREEPEEVHDTRHVGDAARAHLEGEQLRRVGPEGRPSQTVRSVGEEDADQNAVGKAPGPIGGVH